jgi:hypothetical protein
MGAFETKTAPIRRQILANNKILIDENEKLKKDKSKIEFKTYKLWLGLIVESIIITFLIIK